MAITIDRTLCVGCGCCMDACEHGALEFELDRAAGWEKAALEEESCTECEDCAALCPVEALVGPTAAPRGEARKAQS